MAEKIWKAELLRTAFTLEQFPAPRMPEIAMAGRSNVGKSSLINALVGQAVAHVSAKPGKTRSVNFYKIYADRPFLLVDLPGFGYAARARAEKNSWADLIEHYITSRRAVIALVVHLVDLRHGMVGGDKSLQGWLSLLGVTYQVVMTKADKIARTKRIPLSMSYVASGMRSWSAPLVTSSQAPETIEQLREFLDVFLVPSRHTLPMN